MLGISFSGRYNRKKYWMMVIVPNVLFGLFLFACAKLLNVKHDFQIAIATQIMQVKGKITHNDIEQYKENIEKSNSTDLRSKKALEDNIASMETMSDVELTEMAKGTISITDIGLFALVGVLEIYIMLFNISVFVRRGHDLNKSGWISFIVFLIPLINLIFGIYYGFFKGDTADNQYGPVST